MRNLLQPGLFLLQPILIRFARQMLSVTRLKAHPDTRRQAKHSFKLQRCFRCDRLQSGQQPVHVLGREAETLRQFKLRHRRRLAVLVEHIAGETAWSG